MKKKFGFLTVICLAFSLLLLPQSALADSVTLFTGLTASGTFGCGGGSTSPCDLNGYYKVSVQFTCTAGPCTDEIKLWQRNTPNDAYAVVLDLFNTGANDLGYSNIGYGQVYAEVIWTGGTLQGTLIRLK